MLDVEQSGSAEEEKAASGGYIGFFNTIAEVKGLILLKVAHLLSSPLNPQL